MTEVAVGIILRDDEVLFCQRKPNARYGSKWEFPGGKVEKDETPAECLLRELHEELGIDARIDRLFHRQHSTYPDGGEFDVYYYIIRTFSGQPINKAFEQLTWVPIDRVGSYDVLSGNLPVMTLLRAEHARQA
jgi:8-oxo-dGTP diphosphatase